METINMSLPRELEEWEGGPRRRRGRSKIQAPSSKQIQVDQGKSKRSAGKPPHPNPLPQGGEGTRHGAQRPIPKALSDCQIFGWGIRGLRRSLGWFPLFPILIGIGRDS